MRRKKRRGEKRQTESEKEKERERHYPNQSTFDGDHVSGKPAAADGAELGEMVRCCRPIQSRPSCYNLHRVRVDVRRLRPLASTSASARGGAAGESGASAAQGGGTGVNPRSRFRYGPRERERERERMTGGEE